MLKEQEPKVMLGKEQPLCRCYDPILLEQVTQLLEQMIKHPIYKHRENNNGVKGKKRNVLLANTYHAIQASFPLFCRIAGITDNAEAICVIM